MSRLSKMTTRITSLVSAPSGSAPPMTRESLAARTIDGLAAAGFTHAFGIPGRHVQALFRALPGAGIEPITTRHEQGAVYMADGFARAAGRPALVIATAGPGAGNLVTGVANAYADGTPLVCLTGAPPRHFASRGAFQELGDDHAGVTPAVFAPFTRYNAQLSHVRQLEPALRLTLTALQAGGPVNLSFPADLLDAPAPAVRPVEALHLAGEPDAALLDELAGLLAAAGDVLILAGRGALGASAALTALAERLQAPVVTTLHGRGSIDEDHPLALGPQGFSASNWAESWLESRRPAVVLALGTSMREISTNVYHNVFNGTEALIHCTRDARAIGRHFPATHGVVADVESLLAGLLARLPQQAPAEALARFKAETPRFDAAALDSAPGRVSPRRVVEALRAALSDDDVLVVDTGNAVPWSARYFPVRLAGSYLASLHLAAMGWGVAAAIGVQAARPRDRVVALVGDGCFQMTGMEIATAVQHGLPVVWVVLNDARYNMVYQGSRGAYGEAIPSTELSVIDCARVAEGLGALGLRVDHASELAGALEAALASGRPAVIDVAIDPDLCPPMAGRFEALRRFEETTW